jgi:Adaptin C-terminal domain
VTPQTGGIGGGVEFDLMGDPIPLNIKDQFPPVYATKAVSEQASTPITGSGNAGFSNNMMDLMDNFPPMTLTPAVSEQLNTPIAPKNSGLDDLMGLDSLTTPTNLANTISTPTGGPLDFDFLGGSITPSMSTPVTQPTHINASAHDDFEFDDFQAPSTSGLVVSAFKDENIEIKFICKKADGNQQRTLIDVTYDNLTSQAISGLDLKLSPAKHLNLAAFNPLGVLSLTVGARNVVTHQIEVVNSLHGQKAIALKLQTSYVANGMSQTKQSVISDFQANY